MYRRRIAYLEDIVDTLPEPYHREARIFQTDNGIKGDRNSRSYTTSGSRQSRFDSSIPKNVRDR